MSTLADTTLSILLLTVVTIIVTILTFRNFK